MIYINNNPLNINELVNEYAANSIERQLIQSMNSSPDTYRYNSLDELRFELLLRREIANASRELNNSRFSFAVFHKSRANPMFWDRTSNGGFRLKSGVRASDAIIDIFRRGEKYATECATAMLIVYYKALLNVFGEEKFNRTVKNIYMMNWHNIDPIIGEVGVPRKVGELLIGDRAYIKNPDVDPKHPEWQGENIIVLPHGLNYGHGMGIQTVDYIIRALNSKRRRGSTRTAYLMDVAARPNFKKLASIYYSAVL